MKTQLLFCCLILSVAAQGQGCIPVRNIVGFGQFMRSEYEVQEDTNDLAGKRQHTLCKNCEKLRWH